MSEAFEALWDALARHCERTEDIDGAAFEALWDALAQYCENTADIESDLRERNDDRSCRELAKLEVARKMRDRLDAAAASLAR